MKRTDEEEAGTTEIALTDLRDQLGALVRRAAQGEEIIITVRGLPAARLAPLEDRLQELIRLGEARPPEYRITDVSQMPKLLKIPGGASHLIER